MRTGKAYRQAINDERSLWVDGKRVSRVSEHASFEATVERIGELLDAHTSPEHQELLTNVLPSGERVSACYTIPTSSDDLVRLGGVSTMFAGTTLGMLGRLWDPSASYIVGMYNLRDDVGALRPATRDVITNLFERARSETLLGNVAFVDPPFGRMLPPSETPALRITSRTEDGIVVNGAKTLCTGAAYSDELLVVTAGPSVPHRPPEQVVGFVVPPSWPGLRILCRSSAIDGVDSRWRTALRGLDEIDCCLVFEDAQIPNERVLYAGEGAVATHIWDAIVAWDKHSFLRRIVTKFEALFGLGYLMAEGLGVVHLPRVQEAVFDIGRHHAILQRLVSDAESRPEKAPGSGGAVVPEQTGLLLALRYAIDHYPEALQRLELLGGQGLVLLPTPDDLSSSETGPLYERYIRGPTMDAQSRARLLTLAAQLVGSRLASRQRLLDYYAVGGVDILHSQLRPRLDWSSGLALIHRFLESMDRR